MAQRTCEVDGCERPHQARGMCGSHYGTWHRRQHGRTRNERTYTITCIICGSRHEATRRDGKFCSDACKGTHYSVTKRTRSPLPANHLVMVLIAQADDSRRAARAERKALTQRSKFEWRTERECPGCACWFTPLYTPNTITCSKRCARRVARWRRNAAERGARGSFTWAEFMRIARKFDFCCAYCGTKPERLDPDHVAPLSRGGSNAPSNLLPSCFMCNSSKCAMTLPEWAVWRAERGQEPRRTEWATGDARYTHLTDAVLARISPAA